MIKIQFLLYIKCTLSFILKLYKHAYDLGDQTECANLECHLLHNFGVSSVCHRVTSESKMVAFKNPKCSLVA